MVFCFSALRAFAPGQRAPQKPRQPSGLQPPGRVMVFRGQGAFLFTPQPQRAVLPPYRAAGPVRGSLSPDGGNRGGMVVAPPASPLKPGKNKRVGLWGHGRLGSSHIRPVSYRVYQKVYLCITNNHYSMLRVSRKRPPSPSAASPGH
jgi:hypothetical protein